MSKTFDAQLIDAMIDHDMNWHGAGPEMRQEILLWSSLLGNTMSELTDGTDLPPMPKLELASLDITPQLKLAGIADRTAEDTDE